MEEQASDVAADATYSKAKASKFNFKSKSGRRSKRSGRENGQDGSRRRNHGDEEEQDDPRQSHRESRRRHKHKHRKQRDDTHPTSTRDGEYYDPDHRYRESLFDYIDEASPGPDAEDVFRESLFDALADDEGAAYWEGVYGQPVHVYPDTKPGPDGKLERMTEEEYADYVRGKMWEKSHQHILEERAAKEKARQKKKEAQAHAYENVSQEEEERKRMMQQVDESLRRGAERKKAREAAAAWDAYVKKWDELKSAQNLAQESQQGVRHLIPWPVVSGSAKHVSKDDIERFLRSSGAWKDDPGALLKVERVRWHPDKMQQRFGQHIDVDTMKSVTAVFQVIDRLWTERR